MCRRALSENPSGDARYKTGGDPAAHDADESRVVFRCFKYASNSEAAAGADVVAGNPSGELLLPPTPPPPSPTTSPAAVAWLSMSVHRRLFETRRHAGGNK